MTLRIKVIVWVVGSLVLVLGIAGVVNTVLTHRITNDEAIRSAEVMAENIVLAMSVFGESGDMEGLESFLDNSREQSGVVAVHAFRGEATAREFGPRELGAILDARQQSVLDNGDPVVMKIEDNHSMRYILPLKARKSCLECHEMAAEGEVLGGADVSISTAAAHASIERQTVLMAFALLSAVIVQGLLLWFVFARLVINPVKIISQRLLGRSRLLSTSADSFTSSAGMMANGANQQAASLQQTSASIKQLHARNRRTADSANKADANSMQASKSVDASSKAMSRLSSTMGAIQESSHETSRIIKVIDEIAFQTNLLALNAAVEAARAGEAGRGFAVVAEEVRNLAAGSAEAANNTQQLIENALKDAEEGAAVVSEMEEKLGGIVENMATSSLTIAEVSRATEQQAQELDQINESVTHVESITQSNAASAEENASASEELTTMAVDLQEAAVQLVRLVGGKQ